MRNKINFHFLYLTVLFIGISCKTKNANPVAEPANKISFTSTVFKVSKAYLSLGGDTTTPELPADFKANVGQRVFLNLVIDSGWVNENGRIYPGIYQKVESDDKKHLFIEDDLMKNHPEGVAAKDGWLVTIMAVVNTADKHYDHFDVSFKVWDKKGKGEITGSYKLYLN